VRQSKLAAVAKAVDDARETARGDARSTTTMARAEDTTEFPVVLRLGPGGSILHSQGADEELAAVVANARRLGRLAGQLLGMDPFVAMECTVTNGRLLIYDEDNGETVALRPRTDTSLQSLRDRLGL
jgi:hypothetical protein